MLSRRIFAALEQATLIAAACAALSTPTEVLARDLTIVAYGGGTQASLRKAYFESFERATGTPIVEDELPTLAKVRAMVQTGNITWDLLDQESPDAALGCEEGLFERLDLSGIDVSSYYPGTVGDCGLGMYVAGNVMAYNGDKIDDPPRSWADFWNVEKWPGKRGFWFTPKGALEFALMADGVAPADVYNVLREPGGIDRAFAKLDELKPDILWWKTGGEMINRLASGEYTMTMAWNGRLDVANREDNQNFKIVWSAGFTYVVDTWVMIRGTPNKQKAYEFLKFQSDPRRQAEFMRHIAYSAANQDALQYVDEERQKVLPLAPQNAKYGVEVNDEFWAQHLDSLTERFNAWAAR